MKILHTSDWHLGQNFFTKSRKDEHQAFFTWLLDTVQEHQVDAVIVAGDVFDTGTPPSYARELYNQFVVDLQATQCALVILGGNHDAVSTLNESKQVLACLNTQVIASTDIPEEEQVVTLKTRSGEIGAIVCAIPFVRAKDVMQSRAGETGLDKRQSLSEAIRQHYATCFERASTLREKQKLNVPIIATGHLSALGVSQSDSVRDIYIGTLDGFAVDGFPPADYIALGHIHKAQKVAKRDHIRYSGSPIPLSFDELSTPKSVNLVEFRDNKLQSINELRIPTFQPMAVVKGDLTELEAQLQDISSHDQALPVWLCIEVESQDYLSDLQQRVQALVEDLNLEVLQLKRVRNKQRQLLSQTQRETLSELSPEEVFTKRLEMEHFDGEDAEAQKIRIVNRFQQTLAATLHKESLSPEVKADNGDKAQ